MNKLIPLAIVAITLVAVGCLGSGNTTSPSGTFDCGTNFTCFESYFVNSCGPANVTATASNAGNSITFYSLVTPQANNTCSVFLQVDSITLGPQATANEVGALNAAKPFLSYATMNCAVSQSDGSQLSNPAFLTQPGLLNECSGTLKQLLSQLNGTMG
jgi:hypothetical protein